jgi:hypothetical protein
MYTGTRNEQDVPKLVSDFINEGFTKIEIEKDSIGQWIVKGTSTSGK